LRERPFVEGRGEAVHRGRGEAVEGRRKPFIEGGRRPFVESMWWEGRTMNFRVGKFKNSLKLGDHVTFNSQQL